MKKNKILLATGGTGGHIFPALGLKTQLDKNGYKTIITADEKFIKFHHFNAEHILIPSASFFSKSPLKLLNSALILAQGFIKALWIIYIKKPDLVIGFGGYASFPVMLAALVFKKKIILHEANSVLGKVNKIFLPKADYLTTGFSNIFGVVKKFKDKIVYTGNPIREEILFESKKKNFNTQGLTLLIIGGSQGAKIFGKIVPDMIVNLPQEIKSQIKIIQQVKAEDVANLSARYAREGISYEIKSFFTDVGAKFKEADLVIARAGASTISELVAFGLPAIFIPYPHAADDHQYYNAKELLNQKSAWIVKEDGNASANLLQIVKLIYKDLSILKEYSNNLKKNHQDGVKNILKLVKHCLL